MSGKPVEGPYYEKGQRIKFQQDLMSNVLKKVGTDKQMF